MATAAVFAASLAAGGPGGVWAFSGGARPGAAPVSIQLPVDPQSGKAHLTVGADGQSAFFVYLLPPETPPGGRSVDASFEIRPQPGIGVKVRPGTTEAARLLEITAEPGLYEVEPEISWTPETARWVGGVSLRKIASPEAPSNGGLWLAGLGSLAAAAAGGAVWVRRRGGRRA